MNEINDTLKQLVTGLGPEALTIVGVIAVGYLLRLWPKFPNAIIPHFCCVLGLIGYPSLLKGWSVNNAVVGLVMGFVAWTFHDKILSKLEEKIPLLGTLLKSTPPAEPPAQPPSTTPPTPPAK